MRDQENISHDHLINLLKYNKTTGIFIRRRTGLRTGFVNSKNGFRAIELDGKRYTETRLAVFYETGKWPVGKVQHRGKSRRVTKFNDLNYRLPAILPAMPPRINNFLVKGYGVHIAR